MGTFSIWDWIILVPLLLALNSSGLVRISGFGKDGQERVVVRAHLFTIVMGVGLWILAFMPWPAIDERPGTSGESAAGSEPA